MNVLSHSGGALRSGLFALSALAAFGPTVPLECQDLPPAAGLIDRYVQAVGGRDALLAYPAQRSLGTFEMPMAGLRGELVVVSEAPDRMATRITVPGMDPMVSGYDGRIGWSVEPMLGARLLTGRELDTVRDNALTLTAVRDPALFRTMETVGRTEVGGEPCYRVRLVWQSGRETFDCFHIDTGLLVATMEESESPMGVAMVTSRMEDYRSFGGVLLPSRITIEMMGMEQILTIHSVEFEGVDTSLIDPPAEIRALEGRR